MLIEGFKLKCGNYDVWLTCAQYSNNRLAIQGVCENSEPYGVLTVNIPYEQLGDKEIFVKTWSENSIFAESALKTGLFTDTGKRVQTGHVEAEVWKLADDVYSSKGAPVECYGLLK